MRALRGETPGRTPIWLMRQAGRYLPEYRKLRTEAASFLEFCYTPALATEATLQPIRRFDFDAAILFSDILVIPDALGQRVTFVEGEGPRLDPITDQHAFDALRGSGQQLDQVLETVRRVRGSLAPKTALIGFCGAPWTVASYMIAGKGTPDQAPIRLVAYRDPDFLQAMIDRLVEVSAEYLVAQIDAGANAVQIFESFGGALPPALFERWSLDPVMRMVRHVKGKRPEARIIIFARGIGSRLQTFAETGEVDVLGLDWSIDPTWAADALQPRVTVQGNLDPLALIAGGPALDASVDRIVDAFRGGPHIFNLGHGIQPETPIEHVERLVQRIRGHHT